MAAATPRTDEAQCRFPRNPDLIMDLVPFGAVVPVDFARQLETELSTLRAELAAAKEENDKLDRDLDTEITNRYTAEDAADKLASAALGEDIDWPNHQAAWEDGVEAIAQLRADLAAKGEESQRYRTALEATNRVFFESKRQIAGEANEVRSLINSALFVRAANKGENEK